MVSLKEIDSTRAVSFSGHRPDRLPGNGDPNKPEAQILTAVLQQKIIAAINRGMTAFIHGCMAGFDIYAIEEVIALKQKYPHIKIVSVAPYSVHFFSKEKCWTPDWENRAREVFHQHDFGVSLSKYYRRGIYFERNDVLVDYSSELICYWDGGKGGTKYTVDRAKSKGLFINNLF